MERSGSVCRRSDSETEDFITADVRSESSMSRRALIEMRVYGAGACGGESSEEGGEA